jgi:hypothetical protein
VSEENAASIDFISRERGIPQSQACRISSTGGGSKALASKNLCMASMSLVYGVRLSSSK